MTSGPLNERQGVGSERSAPNSHEVGPLVRQRYRLIFDHSSDHSLSRPAGATESRNVQMSWTIDAVSLGWVLWTLPLFIS